MSISIDFGAIRCWNVYVYSPIKATLHARHTETDSETDKQTDRETYRQYDKFNNMCLAAQNRQKIHKTPYFGIQVHPRSLNLLAIKS